MKTIRFGCVAVLIALAGSLLQHGAQAALPDAFLPDGAPSPTPSATPSPIPSPAITPQPTPNPISSTNKTRVQLSRGETFKLDVRLSEPHHVRIDICTMLRGEKVATMGEGEFGTGTASFEWNGHNDSNSLVATDIYLALIYIDGKLTEKKKFALQR